MKQNYERRPFLTGSRVYGIPNDDSDTDLVILLTMKQIRKLENGVDSVRDTDQGYFDHKGTFPMRLGSLNILCCTSEKVFDSWWIGTQELKAMRPVERSVAVQHFRALRKKMGIK